MEPILPADPTLRVLVLGADAVGILVAVVLCAVARTPRQLFAACAAGPATVAMVGLASAMVLRSRQVGDYGGFAFLRVIEHALFHAAIPIALVALVIAWRRRQRWFAGACGLCAAVLGFVFFWSHFVEPTDLEVTVHEIATDRLPAESPGLRVVVLADLQTDSFSDYEQSVFDRVAELRPDLLLLPGDFIQLETEGFFREHARFLAALRALPRPRLGIYAVEGDVDPMRWRFRDASSFFDDGDGPVARLLDDEFVEFEGEHLQVLGLTQRSSRQRLDDDQVRRVRDFEGLTLVMGHAPEFALPMIRGELELAAVAIAGHTHGGQVVVPGLGPPITLSSVPRAVAGGGLHRFGETLVSVSRGVGLERGHAPRLRLFCRPELVVFDFRPAGSE